MTFRIERQGFEEVIACVEIECGGLVLLFIRDVVWEEPYVPKLVGLNELGCSILSDCFLDVLLLCYLNFLQIFLYEEN